MRAARFNLEAVLHLIEARFGPIPDTDIQTRCLASLPGNNRLWTRWNMTLSFHETWMFPGSFTVTLLFIFISQ